MDHSIYSNKKIRILISSALFGSSMALMSSVSAGPVHAYFADEQNTSPTTGNRILEIDVQSMTQVNEIDVPGFEGHHADNGFNSKIYGVPKGSGYVNVIKLSKDTTGTTTKMGHTKQIPLTHTPRSGDAYNKKFNVILMTAANRPMGSFIHVDTDEVVGTIGEEIDCTLTDGSLLSTKRDRDTTAAATKYQCANDDHGGDQISGHPYWLTPDYAVIVDRANRRLSTYFVWRERDVLKSRLVNHLPTRTSIHQIVPRDRTSLPASQQADFYAIEEGKAGDPNDYKGGIAHALLKLKLTTNGLVLEKRMNLQRTQWLPKAQADRILSDCVTNYRNNWGNILNERNQGREDGYNAIFSREGITRSSEQDPYNSIPLDCFYPGIPGGHNADFAPNNLHLYVPMAGGAMSIIDVNRWKIANNSDIGSRSGPGHTCFSAKHDIAFTTQHGDRLIRAIKGINSSRPKSLYRLQLPYANAGLTSTTQSHTCYIDKNEDFYYNFWVDGGVYYKIDIAAAARNQTNYNRGPLVDSLATGGMPIQGSYIDIDTIKTEDRTQEVALNALNDNASSNGSLVTIDVLANDQGPSGFTLTQVDNPSNGTAVINNGKIDYTPSNGFTGTDGLWYKITGANNRFSSWAFAEIVVTSAVIAQPAPVANQDIVTVTSSNPVTIDPLANDTGSNLVLNAPNVWSWKGGKVALVNGKLSYTPKAGFNGEDKIWYTIEDSQGRNSWNVIVINISGNNSSTSAAPVANQDTVTVTSPSQITINPLANDTGSNLTLQAPNVWSWKGGNVALVSNQLTYKPKDSFNGQDKIWYSVVDSQGRSTWSVIVINISGNGTSTSFPLANADNYTVKTNTTTILNILANDTPTGLAIDTLYEYTSKGGKSAQANNGTAVSYTPKAGFTGVDDFWYVMVDSQGRTNSAQVTITVTN